MKNMELPPPEIIWNLNQHRLLNLLDSCSFGVANRNISFYIPSFSHYKTKYCSSSPNSFPTISITGPFCGLNCRHCGGKVLETMLSATSEASLFDLCSRLKEEGAKGCLISGGCLSNGSVPIDQFVFAIKKIKNELGLTVFVHTGIINVESATKLKEAGVDKALIDIIGSRETAKRVCGLPLAPEQYSNSLKALNDSGLDFVPHVIVGLNDGKLDGEFRALEMIRNVKPSGIVIIAFMPLHGTEMAKTVPPTPVDIAKVTLVARAMFPDTYLSLGCMRPKGSIRRQIDILALKAGVDAIAFPSEGAIKYAKDKGHPVSYSSICCAK